MQSSNPMGYMTIWKWTRQDKFAALTKHVRKKYETSKTITSTARKLWWNIMMIIILTQQQQKQQKQQQQQQQQQQQLQKYWIYV